LDKLRRGLQLAASEMFQGLSCASGMEVASQMFAKDHPLNVMQPSLTTLSSSLLLFLYHHQDIGGCTRSIINDQQSFLHLSGPNISLFHTRHRGNRNKCSKHTLEAIGAKAARPRLIFLRFFFISHSLGYFRSFFQCDTSPITSFSCQRTIVTRAGNQRFCRGK
jgi:hypothetical protein